MNAVTPMDDYYITAFGDVKTRLPGHELPWLARLRAEALDQFARLGFPSPRHEEWKYTPVKPIEKHAFQLASEFCVGLVEEDLGRALMSELNAHRLVFVNGRYTPQLSKPGKLPEGVTIGSLGKALAEQPHALAPYLGRYADPAANGFAALNAAYMGDGAYIQLAKGAAVAKPIHLLCVSTSQGEPAAHHLRNLLVADAGSQATVIEHYVSLGDAFYLNNVVSEVVLAENANLEHYKLQQESAKGFHVATLQVRQARHSRLKSHSFSCGGSLVRNDINSVLDAEGTYCALNGLYIASGKQHVDYHTRIDHRYPHGTSREFYKGVLSGRARAVFNGKVYVHPDAQQSDAEQSNKNLLLSKDAEVDTKPQLEIYADDVKCSHGAAVGQLDEQMLFYLRSRGIKDEIARGMLTYGFAHDIVERMDIAPIQALIEDILITKLPHAAHMKELA